jgi:hypothetical protein
MRQILNVFLLSILWVANASAELPMVSLQQLQPGSYFTWSYFDLANGGAPYSTERYEVLSQANSMVTIVMSTRLDHKQERSFHLTHKFVVDFRKCLNAHKDARQKYNFLVDLYPALADGIFAKDSIPSPGLIFEEKFNCHPQERKGWPDPFKTNYETAETPRGQRNLFQQKRTPGDQIVGFYFLDDPELSGILYHKDFNPQALNHFEMKLVDWKLN